MAKLPAFQFYPGDWRKDMGVQSLSFHDRGVWWEMLCLMHESERRGVLILNGQAMSEESLARLLGLDKQILTTTLTTLITSGVAGTEEQTGAIICRRMVRDEKLRQVRSSAGKQGGNPILLNQKPTTRVKQIPTPSSSSSSSSSEPIQMPSRGKRERTKTNLAKSRHAEFKAAILRYWQSKNGDVEMPWGPAEGRNLEMWLKESPHTTIEQFTGFLRHRFKSDVNHSERPSRWIGNVTQYAAGPLDRFNKPPSGTNGNSQQGNVKILPRPETANVG